MSNSKGEEHLSSVHDNPFIREFGIETVLTRQDVKGRGVRKASVDSLSTVDNDSEQEYHVNSGFVNKLRSKFNQLNEGGNKVTLSRKSASLENLLDSSNSSYGLKSQRHQGKTSYDDSKVHSKKVTHVELRKKPVTSVRTSNRPKSSEEQIGASSKPPILKKKEWEYSTQNHVIRSGTKPPIPKKKSTDSSTVRQSRNLDSNKHKTEHHDWKVAPDLEKIGRENIVIIESSSPCIRRKNDKSEPNKVENVEKVDKDENRQARPLRGKPADENEFPKPNTVSNFRSLFEKTKTTTDVISNWRQSPTRTSAGTDSPTVASPAGTPRSPLVKMNDDNVFENSLKTASSTEVVKDSPRSSSSNESLVAKQSPRNSAAEIAENVDTTSVSRQKSFDVFETSPRDKDDSPSSPTPLSPRLASNMAPVHPLSNIFDSSSVVKKDKPKKPKPAVSARKPSIPKDTIELKHEAEKKKQSLSNIEQTRENLPEKANAERDNSPTQQIKDKNVVSIGRSSGKISPRKTKIFDSSSMVKKDRPSPDFAPSPTDKFFSSSPLKDQPPADSMENKTETTDSNVLVNQVKLNGTTEKSQSGGTLFKTNIAIKNEPSKPESSKGKISVPMLPQENMKNEPVKPRSKPADNKASPVTGMSSYLANKLKKSQPDSNGQQTALINGTAPSPVPRKRQAPSAPVVNGTDKFSEKEELPPPLPTSPEPEIPKSNIDDLIKRKKKPAQTASKMVFDSSKIVKKKKETPKRKPPRKSLEELNKNVMLEPAVPLLDLSSITNDKAETEYQEGYIPTEIKPCPFLFVGAEVKFEQSPYKKKKKMRVKLAFDENATTFEYEREESALEAYLRDHPEEVEEARRQEEEYEGVVTVTPGDDDTPATPEPAADTTMKSNTVIGMSSGALTNYKSKMQVQDFQFGSTPEPDIYMATTDDNDDATEDGMQLRPADDSELDTFSAETGKADLLF